MQRPSSKKKPPSGGFFLPICFKRLHFNRWYFPILGIRLPRWLMRQVIGLCLGPVILIRSDYWFHEPTWQHELVHSKQAVHLGFFPHFLLYFASRPYRLKAELEAFAVEINCNLMQDQELQKMQAVEALFQCYGLQTDRHSLMQSLENFQAKFRLETVA